MLVDLEPLGIFLLHVFYRLYEWSYRLLDECVRGELRIFFLFF